MSSSQPETCIFTTDSPESAKKKIMNAFTGGRATVREQRELGGEPNVCPIFQYDYYVLLGNEADMEELRQNCISGKILCGECKERLSEKAKEFLLKFQHRRREAKRNIEKYLL